MVSLSVSSRKEKLFQFFFEVSGSAKKQGCDSGRFERDFNVQCMVDFVSVHMNDGLNLEGVMTGFGLLWDANLKFVIVNWVL